MVLLHYIASGEKQTAVEELRPYKTIKTSSQTEQIIQRSRFIGRCFPVKTEQEALRILAETKKTHWDATHNCYAYSIGTRGSCARYSDDGEPGGTAGLPMMEVLRHREVTDVLCIVTRYFGGILLGTGGLVRAYSRSCSEALEAAGVVRMAPGQIYAFEVPYSQWALFQQIAGKYGQLTDIEYAECVRCKAQVPKEQGEILLQDIRERTNDTLKGIPAGERYLPFEEA